jgi:hypothetical protein
VSRFRLILIAFVLALLASILVPSLPLRTLLLLTGGSTSISSARWLDFSLLEVRDIRYRDALRIKSLTLRLSPRMFLGQIPEVRLYEARGWLSRLATPSSSRTTGRFPLPLTIQKLFVAESTLLIDNLGPGLPIAPLRLGDTTPLLFTQVRLGARSPGDAADELQSATTEDLVFYSPHDPLAPVLSFERIDVAFTWDGLTRNRLELLRITRPTVYLGDDLFAFANRVDTADEAVPAAARPEPFQIADFEVTDGRLALSLYGQPVVQLPIRFAASRENLVLRDFSELQLATTFTIPPSDLDYPAQDLSVRGLRGNLYFNLGQQSDGSGAENVVPTVFADSLTWKKLTAEKLSLSVTVNADGLFGRANAFLGGGSLDGGVSLLFKNDLPWSAWASVTGMESACVTDALTPDQFRLSSLVDALAVVSAQGKHVRGGWGHLTFKDGGRLQIPSVAKLADRIPQDWDWIKKGSAKAALSVLEDYSFDQGEIRLTYLAPQGRLKLNLRGPQGLRDIDIQLR